MDQIILHPGSFPAGNDVHIISISLLSLIIPAWEIKTYKSQNFNIKDHTVKMCLNSNFLEILKQRFFSAL